MTIRGCTASYGVFLWRNRNKTQALCLQEISWIVSLSREALMMVQNTRLYVVILPALHLPRLIDFSPLRNLLPCENIRASLGRCNLPLGKSKRMIYSSKWSSWTSICYHLSRPVLYVHVSFLCIPKNLYIFRYDQQAPDESDCDH